MDIDSTALARRHGAGRALGWMVLGAVGLWVASAIPTPQTFYVSPTGGGTACTEAEPCALSAIPTWAKPGDTWLLLDGTYHDVLDIDCTQGARSGLPAARISVAAAH